MKSAVGERVRRVIESSGRSQKEVALDVFEKAGSVGKPDTFEQKLSKLLNGDPEGVRFFFDDPDRSDALRLSLGSAAEHWQHWRESPVLVALDMSPRTRRFLDTQNVVVVHVAAKTVVDEVKAWTGPRIVVIATWERELDRAIAGALEALETKVFTIVPDGNAEHALRWKLHEGPALFPVVHEPVPPSIDGWPTYRSSQAPKTEKEQRDYERYGCVLLSPRERFVDVDVVGTPPDAALLLGPPKQGKYDYERRKNYVWSANGTVYAFGVDASVLGSHEDIVNLDNVANTWADSKREEVLIAHPQHRRAWLHEQLAVWRKQATVLYALDPAQAERQRSHGRRPRPRIRCARRSQSC